MNRTLVIVAAMLVTAASARSQSPEQIFQQANDLYQQGKPAEAATQYETLLGNGYVSGDLYYNLGNAYYKTGSIARAVLNYERALRLMPADDDLRHNLQLANLMITDKIEATPRLFLWDYWDAVKNAFSLPGITWAVYAAFVMVIASLIAFILGASYLIKRTALWAGAGSIVVFAAFVTIFLARLADVRRDTDAIVMASIVTVKNSPDERSSDAFVLHSGVKVQVVDRVGAWAKVRLADGKVGWMQEGNMEMI